MNTLITEVNCESCGASANESWETDAIRRTVLQMSLEQSIHQGSTGWRVLCDECEEGLQNLLKIAPSRFAGLS